MGGRVTCGSTAPWKPAEQGTVFRQLQLLQRIAMFTALDLMRLALMIIPLT